MKMYDDFSLFVGPGGGYAVYLVWVLTGSPSFLAARVLSLLLSWASIVAVYLLLARRGIRGPASPSPSSRGCSPARNTCR